MARYIPPFAFAAFLSNQFFYTQFCKMKKLLLGICFYAISIPTMMAQVILRIQDAQTKEWIAGVTVELKNGQTRSSDVNGRVSLEEPTGEIRISCVGYRTKLVAPSAFNQQKEWLVAMEKSALLLQPVEIKAIRASDRAPFTKTNLQAEEIAANNLGQDLPFLLNQTPGVVVHSDAGNGVGYTGIRIRGTDPTRINITLNGIPYNDAESQGVFFVNLPDFASSVNSIQIQRGVGTSTNGGGAFGASINMSTNETNEHAYAELNNSGGSFNTWKHTVKAGTGLLNKHFTVDARLSSIRSDGFVDRASSDLKSFYFSTAYIDSLSSLRLNIFSGREKTYQAWYGIPEAQKKTCRTCNSAGTERPGSPYDNETDNYQQDHYQLFYNRNLNTRWTLSTALFYTKGKGYYEQYKADESYADYGLPNQGNQDESDLIRQLWLDNDFYGTTASGQYKYRGTQIVVGGGFHRYEGQHRGEIIWAEHGVPQPYRWYDQPARKSDLNVYAKWQQRIQTNWESFVDIQYRQVDYRINGFRNNPNIAVQENYQFINPKAGLSYRKHNWNAYLSFAVGSKEPNRDDFEAGVETRPKPEFLYNTELGLERKGKKFTGSATLYHMFYRDQLVLTGKINDVGAYTRTNIPKSYRLGLELQGSWLISSTLTFQGNLAWSANKILQFTEYLDSYDINFDYIGQETRTYEKTNLAFSPSWLASASLIWIPNPAWTITLPGKYVGRQYLDNTSNRARSLDAFYTQDLRIQFSPKRILGANIQLIAQINNLLNTQYEPNGYTFSYLYDQALTTENFVYPMAGIHGMIGCNIRIGK